MLRGRCIRELSAIRYQCPGSKKKENPAAALGTLATSHPPLAAAFVSPTIPVDARNSPVSGSVDDLGGGPSRTEKQIPHPAKSAGIRDDNGAVGDSENRMSTEPRKSNYSRTYAKTWGWRGEGERF